MGLTRYLTLLYSKNTPDEFEWRVIQMLEASRITVNWMRCDQEVVRVLTGGYASNQVLVSPEGETVKIVVEDIRKFIKKNGW